MVIITEKIGSGRTRTCNFRCYQAKGSVCRCLCCGKNHGVGLAKVGENARGIAQKLTQEHQDARVTAQVSYWS